MWNGVTVRLTRIESTGVEMAKSIPVSDTDGSTNQGEWVAREDHRGSSYTSYTILRNENDGGHTFREETGDATDFDKLVQSFRRINRDIAVSTWEKTRAKFEGLDLSVEILPDGFRLCSRRGEVTDIKTRSVVLQSLPEETRAQLKDVYFV
jgi:hypothetical protein